MQQYIVKSNGFPEAITSFTSVLHKEQYVIK